MSALYAATDPLAHGFVGPGWLHPLTGPDHMLAMIAVGAWSAQLGGRALYLVPTGFVCFMVVGGTLGFSGYRLPGTELAIAASVLLLGLAVSVTLRLGTGVAAGAVAMFGVAHGYAHGVEFHGSTGHIGYVAGFVATTAGLHIIGAVGALLLLDQQRGARYLRIAGTLTSVAGSVLIATTLLR
jgi:urease accessory protein